MSLKIMTNILCNTYKYYCVLVCRIKHNEFLIPNKNLENVIPVFQEATGTQSEIQRARANKDRLSMASCPLLSLKTTQSPTNCYVDAKIDGRSELA